MTATLDDLNEQIARHRAAQLQAEAAKVGLDAAGATADALDAAIAYHQQEYDRLLDQHFTRQSEHSDYR